MQIQTGYKEIPWDQITWTPVIRRRNGDTRLAVRIAAAFNVEQNGHTAHGEPNDYIVQHPDDGYMLVIQQDAFDSIYEAPALQPLAV